MILGHCSQLQLKLVQRAISSANKFNFTMSESAQEEKWLWSFGYGSNMDVTALRAKKKVDIKGKIIWPRSVPT